MIAPVTCSKHQCKHLQGCCSHIFLYILRSYNAISERVQGDFCSLSSFAMSGITATDRQLDVHFFDSTLKM